MIFKAGHLFNIAKPDDNDGEHDAIIRKYLW